MPEASPQILLCWHARFHDWWLGPRQLTVGPFVEDRVLDAGRHSRRIPPGAFDLAALVRDLPPAQRPDLIVVVLDSTRSSIPLNLAAIDCPKLLLLGDTHHLSNPIGFPLGYALKERFDKVVGNHVPQHLHFFREAGLAVGWVPGAWVRDEAFADLPRRPDRVVHVGQVGDHHPVRRDILTSLQASGLPVDLRRTDTQAEAAALYAAHLAALNISLNGDLNQRVFETVFAGGCLVTDRLAPQAGLETLFRPGEHLLSAPLDDIGTVLEDLLAAPGRAAEIARRGRAHYLAEHSEAIRAGRLLAEGLGGADDRARAPLLPPDARLARPAADPGDLMRRIRLYEAAQEHHRLTRRPVFRLGEDVPAPLRADHADLARAVFEDAESPTAAIVWSSADVEAMVDRPPLVLTPEPDLGGDLARRGYRAMADGVGWTLASA